MRPTRPRSIAGMLRVLLVVGIAVAVASAVAAVGSVVLIQRDSRTYWERVAPLLQATNDQRTILLQAQTAYRGFVLTHAQSLLQRFHTTRKEFETSSGELARRADGVVPPDQVAAAENAADAWFVAAQEMLATAQAGRSADLHPTAVLFDRATDAFQRLDDTTLAVRDARHHHTNELIAAALTATSIAVAFDVVFCVVLAVAVRGSMVIPLRKLQHVVARLATEQGIRADAEHGAREIATLAAGINRLADYRQASFAEREQRMALFAMTNEIAPILTSARTSSDEWSRACAALGAGLRADRVAIHGADGDSLQLIGSWSADAGGEDGETGDAYLAAAESIRVSRSTSVRRLLVAETLDDFAARFPPSLHQAAVRSGIQAGILAPLVMQDRIIGWLSAAATAPRRWTGDEIDAVERASGQAARALIERHYLESLAVLDRQKAEFLAMTSHELRTPLTSISGYLEMLLDEDYGPLPPALRPPLKVIERNVARLGGLIKDLLFLNRVDSGRATPQVQRCDLGVTLRSIREMFAPTAAAEGVELRFAVPEQTITVDVDTEQIERAMINVVSNAVKFTPKGGTVTVTTHVDATAGRVEIGCRDTGLGIPAVDVDRVFERFHRAGNARAIQVPGTGLGLAIVRTILEAHGGTVRLSSTEGEGTTVDLCLPLAASH